MFDEILNVVSLLEFSSGFLSFSDFDINRDQLVDLWNSDIL